MSKTAGGTVRHSATRLSPLNPAEQEVAEQNCHLVDNFLHAQRLSREEFYDVAVFGYLLAVKKWFRRPDLYRYGFPSVAWSAMRGCVGNERAKQSRRVHTVSLEDPIPGTDGLTWGDIITEDHLPYRI